MITEKKLIIANTGTDRLILERGNKNFVYEERLSLLSFSYEVLRIYYVEEINNRGLWLSFWLLETNHKIFISWSELKVTKKEFENYGV